MPWLPGSSRREEAAQEHPARFSGTSVSELPFSSKTSRYPFRNPGCKPRLLSAPHLKRNTLHDSENERREAIILLLRFVHDLANGRRVVVLDASPQRERQKVLRQSC